MWNNFLARGAPVKDGAFSMDSDGLALEAWPQDDDDAPLEVALVTPDVPAPERLLLVEDDEAIRRMYRVTFERRGFEVVEAQDGAEALLYAATQGFDLVVSDLNMPRLDGWGLLARLREDARTRDLPVALLSCENDLREALRAGSVGAQAYISKGTRLELVAQEIMLLCEPTRRIRRALRAPSMEPVPTAGVGVLPLLREIAAARWSGALRMRGAKSHFEVTFREGEAVRAEGGSGPFRAQGQRAFNAFVGLEKLAGELRSEKLSVTANLEGSLDSLVATAILVANENRLRNRTDAMVKPRCTEVDAALYERYRLLASPEARETAALACEARLTPAQVIARSDRSPITVERELIEIVRRGVVRLA
ncbi:MAG: response regulator [Myxococcota bacterium]|nr:response regulator [Myxococcota bacterium]